ncbi:formylglycine-generating enzyme family protein [Tetragenococcus halophilus]|uniref:formylglycine-generating enzyme family protein n=1 Tax=Tetragenococcus halophilus TaxID=51669 RepID=UPI0015B977B6|nr:formylglycine-generating enzyme family protein [Tetragenococcus halophilus]NWN99648.1 formylglycine-generating enzyme family protein [Tetragenococcus halophilus]
MISIPKGSYQIGTDEEIGFVNDNEGPKITVHLPAFLIDETTVTNRAFKEFVDDTGYITESEKFAWSFVFHYFLSEETKRNSQTVPGLKWWYAVPGADWLHPEGPGSTIKERMDHPVVQVSRNDAIAYCQWANKRLPTEAEWEVAAKGGTSFEKYPWGENFLENDRYHCNIWQGNFPVENSLEDGFANTAPAKYYESNGYGLYQALGNVWEWCLNPARINLDEFTKNDRDFFWKNYQQVDDEVYATRGGSFLCHQSYCKRYRIAARNGNTGMSAANNLGFRCVR